MLHPHAIANRPVTNGEWHEFIADGGYPHADAVAVSEGWDWVQREGIAAPLYWHGDGTHFTLAGRREIDPAAPVAHVSYYEADAFARWAGARLPTEAEWEELRRVGRPAARPPARQAGAVAPAARRRAVRRCLAMDAERLLLLPRLRARAEGAVGEYNGKFMSGQLVLKGASCATPRGHSRASYRNFFPPAARWQFTGVRLARDA